LIHDGAVYIEDRVIRAVGDRAELQKWFRDESVDKIDARGGIVLPGMINAHTHLYSAFARGLAVRGACRISP